MEDSKATAVPAQDRWAQPPKWWFSYSSTTVTRIRWLPKNRTHVLISVVLDAGTIEQFSGVRIIVAVKENLVEVLGDKPLQHQFESKHSYRTRACVPYRNFLENQSAIQRRTFEMTANPSLLLRPLCTIIFEVQNLAGASEAPLLVLAPLTHLEHDAHWRVIYDYVQPHKPDHPCVTLHLDLISSLPMQTAFRFSNFIDRALPVHCIRVLPCKRRTHAPSLPTSTVLRIATFALAKDAPDWKRRLLSLALVQKGWLPIVDLFYKKIGCAGGTLSHIINPPSATAVAHSLLLNPERGRLMEAIYPMRYSEFYLSSAHSSLSEALATIIVLSPNLRIVELPPIPLRIYAKIMTALRQLRQIETFELVSRLHFPDIRSDGEPGLLSRSLNFSDLQRCILNWPHLKNFGLRRFYHDSPESNWSGLSESAASVPKLQKLDLDGGAITQRMLQHLSSASPSTLHTVELRDLENAEIDLYGFLMQISSSIVDLTLKNLHVPPYMQGERGEYALDAAMPHLRKLRYLCVEGDLLSARSISRTRRDMDRDPGQFSAVVGTGPLHDFLYLSICHAPGIDGAELVDAIKITDWQVISIRASVYFDENSISAANDAAQKRGIRFNFYETDDMVDRGF